MHCKLAMLSGDRNVSHRTRLRFLLVALGIFGRLVFVVFVDLVFWVVGLGQLFWVVGLGQPRGGLGFGLGCGLGFGLWLALHIECPTRSTGAPETNSQDQINRIALCIHLTTQMCFVINNASRREEEGLRNRARRPQLTRKPTSNTTRASVFVFAIFTCSTIRSRHAPKYPGVSWKYGSVSTEVLK